MSSNTCVHEHPLTMPGVQWCTNCGALQPNGERWMFPLHQGQKDAQHVGLQWERLGPALRERILLISDRTWAWTIESDRERPDLFGVQFDGEKHYTVLRQPAARLVDYARSTARGIAERSNDG